MRRTETSESKRAVSAVPEAGFGEASGGPIEDGVRRMWALGRFLSVVLLGGGLLLSPETPGAFAQEATGEAAGAAAAAADVQAPAETGTVDEAESGPRVTTQQHGDWLLECYDPAIDDVSCQIKQRIIQQDSDQNILVMSIAFDPSEDTNVIQYVLPLDFLLTPGVSVEVETYQATVGVNRCAAQGCFVEGTADQAFIDAMEASRTGGRVVIVSRTGQKVGIGFSGSGFTRAYEAMVAENERFAQAAAAGPAEPAEPAEPTAAN